LEFLTTKYTKYTKKGGKDVEAWKKAESGKLKFRVAENGKRKGDVKRKSRAGGLLALRQPLRINFGR
jgi:hypothetical protein